MSYKYMHTDGNEKYFLSWFLRCLFLYIKRGLGSIQDLWEKQLSAYFLYTKTRMIPSTPSSWATISLSTSPTTSSRV